MALEKIKPRVVDVTGNYTFNDVTVTGNLSAPTANISNLTVTNLVTTSTSITLTGNLSTTANITAGNIKTNHLLYANGDAWAIGTGSTVSGSNTQVQFNDSSSFGASANFTFNKNTNTLTVTNISGNGNSLTNLTGANVTGTVPNATSATTAGTVTTASQPNITSVGTLSSLNITGNLTSANANLGNLTISNYFSGNGSLLTSILGGNVTGNVGNALYAYAVAGANVSGAVTYAATANAVAGANVLGQVGNALVAGTVYTNAQPNITSVGTLTGLTVTGNSTINNVSLTGNIIPGVTNTYALGNATHYFKDAFIGPGSLYVNGKKVLEEVSGTINFTTDINQNLKITTSGSGDIIFDPTGTGLISIKGPLQIEAGTNITSSDGNSIHLANPLSVDSITTHSANTDLSLSANGTGTIKLNDDVTISGNLTVSGTTTYINTETVQIYDNIIDLNSNFTTGTPTENAGLRVLRGDDAAVVVRWNESTDKWQYTTDGSAYVDIVGTTSLGVTNLGNSATANYFTGNGSLLTSITGGNITGQVGNALVAGTVYTNAQPNITSLGTLTSLGVTGNITSGNATLGNLTTSNYFTGNGSLLTSITGGNITGQVGNALVAGTVYTNAQPNITSIGTLTSLIVGNITANSTFGNGTITATGNITAGNLITSGSGGNISGANYIVANYFSGSGNNLSNIQGANVSGFVSNANIANTAYAVAGSNVSGQVGNALIAGTVYTNAQPNITSVGTLAGITATGVLNFTGASNVSLGPVANVKVTGGSSGQYLQTDGSGNLSWATLSISTASISNGNSNVNIPSANGNINISAVGNANVLVVTGTGVNVSGTLNATGNITAANITTSGSGGNISGANNISANTFTGNGSLLTSITGANVTGAVSYATTANSVAGGNVSGAVAYATTANSVAGANVSGYVPNANIANTAYSVSASNISGTINLANYATTANSVAGANVSGYVPNANIANTAYSVSAGNISGTINLANYATTANSVAGANVSGAVSYATTANSVAGANVSGYVPNANIANTAYSVSASNISGTINLANYATTANAVAGSNVSGQVGNALIAGTVYTNAQPNITSVGTLSSLTVTANITAGNVNAGNLITANYSSAVLVTAAQPNITSVGTLTSLSVTGNITSGNANLGNSVVANFFTGSGAGLTSVIAVTAGTVTTNAQPNVTSVGTLTSLTVGNITANSTFGNGTITATGNINFTGANVSLGAVGNIKITGGTAGYFITTDGAGNLSWGAAAGGGGVSATGSNTQIQFNDGGVLGATSNLVFDKTTNTFTTGRVVASIGANLGSNISNIYMGGGGVSQILATDGSGNLTWVAQPTATITVDNFTGNGVQTAFTLSTTPSSINQTIVNYNGAFQLRTSAYTLSGPTLTFTEAPSNGSLIEVTTTMGSTSGSGAFVTRTYTGNGVATTYTVTSGVTVSSVLVTENGLVQTPTTDYTIAGTTLTFITAPANGVVIQIRELAIAIATTVSPAYRAYTGNGVATTFTVTSGLTANSLIVAENGILQRPTTDYTVSGSTLTFVTAPNNGVDIQIRELSLNGGMSTGGTSLPYQGGNSGKYLTTDGATATWSTVSALPTQTGNSGKYLTTDGATATWSTVTSGVTLGKTVALNMFLGI